MRKPGLLSCIAVILSVIAIILSVFSGRCKCDTFSVMAVAFSILITILMAWNIYALIDVKDTAKEIVHHREKLNEMEKDIEELDRRKANKKQVIKETPQGKARTDASEE